LRFDKGKHFTKIVPTCTRGKQMNKVFDLYSEAFSNKISKIELKKKVKEYIANLDIAIKYLKSVDAEKFIDGLLKNFPIAAKKAYEEEKISEENVEAVRKMSIAWPSELSQAMYDMNRKMLDYCKQLKKKKE
jgi:type I site-specific restriction-modification system R (restriction) subunit